MHQVSTDPTRRFSDRVQNYVRYRPAYPEELIRVLCEETGLTPASVVADVGSGTGISSELFLRFGSTVYAVEPNREMRASAEVFLRKYPRFHSVAGTAEATGLPNDCVDYVVAGQAFHWFNVDEAKREFTRILRPTGWVALFWNSRRIDSSPFLRAYEALLQQYGTDYREVQHKRIGRDVLTTFFSPTHAKFRTFYNEQQFDFDGLSGRLLSSSYTPNQESPMYRPMLHALAQVFEEYQEQGRVRFEYDTEIYFGHLT